MTLELRPESIKVIENVCFGAWTNLQMAVVAFLNVPVVIDHLDGEQLLTWTWTGMETSVTAGI